MDISAELSLYFVTRSRFWGCRIQTAFDPLQKGHGPSAFEQHCLFFLPLPPLAVGHTVLSAIRSWLGHCPVTPGTRADPAWQREMFMAWLGRGSQTLFHPDGGGGCGRGGQLILNPQATAARLPPAPVCRAEGGRVWAGQGGN